MRVLKWGLHFRVVWSRHTHLTPLLSLTLVVLWLSHYAEICIQEKQDIRWYVETITNINCNFSLYM
jgi:cytochrome b subunit of formate dehydrogenase